MLKPEVFDLSQAVDGMRSMLSRLIGEDIELVTVYGARQPIHCDRGQIEQVLLNLVVNARDAMPAGGRLTLETRDTTLQADNVKAREMQPDGTYSRAVPRKGALPLRAQLQFLEEIAPIVLDED